MPGLLEVADGVVAESISVVPVLPHTNKGEIMKRIYVVENLIHPQKQLVKAHTQSEAIKIVVSGTYRAQVADQETLVELVGKGVTVTEATQ